MGCVFVSMSNGMCRQVEVSVPEDAFEMNYIFTDGEGATDNNEGKNYMTVVKSSMTPEAWEEKAIDRQVNLNAQNWSTAEKQRGANKPEGGVSTASRETAVSAMALRHPSEQQRFPSSGIVMLSCA